MVLALGAVSDHVVLEKMQRGIFVNVLYPVVVAIEERYRHWEVFASEHVLRT
jgi:hypothetical protein